MHNSNDKLDKVTEMWLVMTVDLEPQSATCHVSAATFIVITLLKKSKSTGHLAVIN